MDALITLLAAIAVVTNLISDVVEADETIDIATVRTLDRANRVSSRARLLRNEDKRTRRGSSGREYKRIRSRSDRRAARVTCQSMMP